MTRTRITTTTSAKIFIKHLNSNQQRLSPLRTNHCLHKRCIKRQNDNLKSSTAILDNMKHGTE